MLKRNKNWVSEHKRSLLVGLGLILLIGGVLVFYQGLFNVRAMTAPPPAGHRFLAPPPPPTISKVLCSQAAAEEFGSSCLEAETTLTNPLPVIINQEFCIVIDYNPGEDEAAVGKKIKRIIEHFPKPGFLQFVEARIEAIDITGTANVSPDQPVPNPLIFDLTGLPADQQVAPGENETIQITVVLRAVQYGRVDVETGNSRIEYGSNQTIDLPPGAILIRDILGPVGDVYSHFSIDRRIAPEKQGIDVVAAREGIDQYFRQGVLWYRPNYNLQIKNYPYYKYYHYLKRRVTNRLKNEIAQELPGNQIINRLNDSSNQPQVFLRSGNLNITGGGDLIVRGKKVVIVEGDLVIGQNLKFQVGDHDSQLAFIINNGQIIIKDNVESVCAYLLGDLRCDPAYSCQFILQGSSDSILTIEGAITARKILLGSRQGNVSFIYDSRGVVGLPGISQLLNPLTREIAP